MLPIILVALAEARTTPPPLPGSLAQVLCTACPRRTASLPSRTCTAKSTLNGAGAMSATPSATQRLVPAAAGLCAIATLLTRPDGHIHASCMGARTLGASTAPSEVRPQTHMRHPLVAAAAMTVQVITIRHQALMLLIPTSLRTQMCKLPLTTRQPTTTLGPVTPPSLAILTSRQIRQLPLPLMTQLSPLPTLPLRRSPASLAPIATLLIPASYARRVERPPAFLPSQAAEELPALLTIRAHPRYRFARSV